MVLVLGLVFTDYYAGKTLVTLLLTRAGTAFAPWARLVQSTLLICHCALIG
jgi:hypothetical protein